MTATMTREESGGTWSKVFPADQVTEQKSVLFVKKLLAVAISNITYLRTIFPDNAYADRCIEDLNLKILKDDSSCPGACQMIKWIKGCFDALEKKYLRMMIIGLYIDPDDPETIIESYTFKFSYNKDGGVKTDLYRNNEKVMANYGPESTKKATMATLRTIIILTHSLNPLPDNIMVTMKLLYHDDATPVDYEPPGFESAESDNFQFEDEPMNFKVGDIGTPFHTVRLRIKTDAKQFVTEEREGLQNEEMEEDPIIHCNKPNVKLTDSIQATGSSRTVKKGGLSNVDQDSQPGHTDNINETQNSQPVSLNGISQDEVQGVRCACGCNEDDGMMILCSLCGYWQHGVCYKVLAENNAPETHICDLCATPDGLMEQTDPHLNTLNDVARQATCLWRRALVACSDLDHINNTSMAKRLGIDITVATGLMTRLQKEGYVKNPLKNKRSGKAINKDKLTQEGIKKYFHPPTDMERPSKKKEDEEMDEISQQTEDLAINEIQRSQREKKTQQKALEKMTPEQARGKKRAKSKHSEAEFEISNSQDHSQEKDCAPKKRRKTSKPKRNLHA